MSRDPQTYRWARRRAYAGTAWPSMWHNDPELKERVRRISPIPKRIRPGKGFLERQQQKGGLWWRR